MKRYKNISRDSGVEAYEIGEDFITIQFRGGATYLYDYNSAGRENVERMKILAKAGRGLSTFISRDIRACYARKLK